MTIGYLLDSLRHFKRDDVAVVEIDGRRVELSQVAATRLQAKEIGRGSPASDEFVDATLLIGR